MPSDVWVPKPKKKLPFDEFITSIRESWNGFINNGCKPEKVLSIDILSSWERSLEYGVDPFQRYISKTLKDPELKMEREKNEKMLKYADPVIKHLGQIIEGSNSVMALSDRNGYILEMCGEKEILREASKINFYTGATWSEEVAGTNALGTVIKQKKPIQIVHTEHFCSGWHDWTCVSSPVLNPLTNELLGVIDISGKWKSFPQHTLGMAISMSKMISNGIESKILNDITQLNPFLLTAISAIDEGMLAIDRHKNVIKTNSMIQRIFGRDMINLSQFPNFEILVDKVLYGDEKYIKQEIEINHQWFVISVSPVNTDGERTMGVIVRFQGSKMTAQHPGRKLTSKKTTQIVNYTVEDMVGSSEVLKRVVQKAKKAATIDSTLLITGETGVGKELFAQVVHSESERRNQPFVAVNCGAIPRNLIESELFGYESGSFTGASQKGRKGKFELAHSGTIFLDEIGDMPLEVQVHLLRVLEERKIQRIGADQVIPIDVRVIAATNKDLHASVKKGEFRADLLYRLRVITLEVPSLKERKSDIPLLIQHFSQKLGDKFGKEDICCDPKVMEALQNYSWPGNIRELKNVVEQMLFNMEDNYISLTDLPDDLINRNMADEREEFIELVRKMNGNMSEIAKKLGISRATLYRKMKKYGLTSDTLKLKGENKQNKWIESASF